jgi:hypothetical protein
MFLHIYCLLNPNHKLRLMQDAPPCASRHRENFPTYREYTPMTTPLRVSYSADIAHDEHLIVIKETYTMKHLYILWLLLGVVLLVIPTLAQDAADAASPMATFGDETGLFTVQYPADFIVGGKYLTERVGFPFPNVLLLATPGLFNRVDTSLEPPWQPIAMGDWGVAVIFLPKAMFAEMGVAADAPILDVANAWATMSLDANGVINFQPDAMLLDSGAAAIVITGRGSDDGAGGPPPEDNYLMLHEITDGVIALTTIVSAVDGRTPEMEALHLAITNSIQFTGTAEDVMAMMSP